MPKFGRKGERTIDVGDREVVIFYNAQVIGRVERQLDKGVFGVLEGITDGRSGVSHLAHLVRAGMQGAGNNRAKLGAAYHVIDEAGFTTVVEAVVDALQEALGIDEDVSPEDDGFAQGDGDWYDDEDDARPN